MIFLVSKRNDLPESTEYRRVSVKESIDILSSMPIVGVDTETSGLSHVTSKLLLLQMGNRDSQIVVDTETIDVLEYKDFLQSDRKFLFWNAKFDLKFLFNAGIDLKLGHVYDGMLAEQLLYLGFPYPFQIYPSEYARHRYTFPYNEHTTKKGELVYKLSYSLKASGNKYLNVDFDKTIRERIADEPLSEEVIIYSANDVKYLEDIHDRQMEALKEKDLVRALEYENRFVIVLAYIEFCGVRLDVDKWKKKSDEDLVHLDERLSEVNQWIIDHGDPTFIKDGKCCINWNSPAQMVKLFESLGLNLDTIDKKTKKTKKSVAAEILLPQKDKCSLVEPYLAYKEQKKLVGTYGYNFLKQIEPDGRIHTQFTQLMNTGRLSSGGTEEMNGEKVNHLNLQNLPSDARTRECFIAEKGNRWISADYQGQESRLIASISKDKNLIELFNHGCGDTHSLFAKMAFPDIIGDCPVEEIKSKFKHERQEAKGVEFAINYGGSAMTISKGKNIPIAEAQKIYDDTMKGFPGLAAYQKHRRADVMIKGYILLNPISGHKNFVYDYDSLMLTKSKFNSSTNEKYKRLKNTEPDNPLVREFKNYYKRKADLEKTSINYPIQATGALCFKLFSIFFYNWIVVTGNLYKVKYCIPAHDEGNVEAPSDIAEETTDKLVECMEKAGSVFCTEVKMGADVSRLDNGELPNYWIH